MAQQLTLETPAQAENRWSAYKRIKEAGTVPGHTSCLLTNTSKMPCASWSLPAGRSCPAAVYGAGSICNSCYAGKGMYRQTTVQVAQQRRFQWAVQCMRTPEGQDEFVATMTAAIAKLGQPYHRAHDSGDMFNPAYVRCWTRICRALPGVRFWVPTRTWRFLDRPAWTAALNELASLENVSLRPSALMFDDAPPMIPGWAAGTTASATGFTCPASTQNNECRDCRACWDSPEVPISYHKH